MNKVKPPQERVRGDLGRAQYITSAIRLRLAKVDQFMHPPLSVAPYPSMDRGERPIESRRT